MMSGLGKPALAFGLALLLAGSVQAQQGRGGGRFGGGMGMGMGGGAMLLTNKGVQEELKLTSEQVEKVESIATDMREKSRDEFTKLRDLPEGERPAKMQELMKSMNESLDKELKECFKPEQMKRFHQISLQARGARAFADPEIQAKLGFNDDQKSKVKEILETQMKEMQSIGDDAAGDRQAMMSKMQALRKETAEKMTAVLTDEQKTAWKDLTGEPYEVRFAPRRPVQQ